MCGETEIVFAADGERHGVVTLRPKGAAYDFVRQPLFGLNVYRFMDAGRLLAVARSQPFVSEWNDAGLRISWAATEEHPAELVADYSVQTPDAIDVTLTSHTHAELRAYEVYLSSYFDFAMRPYIVTPTHPAKSGQSEQQLSEQQLLALVDNPLIHGHYLFFPRDAHSARDRYDGRWIDPKNGRTIAHWATGPMFSLPIALMVGDGHYVVQMAERATCIGIGTTYAGDLQDHIVRHNALYISLFGQDTQAGTQQIARLRQVVRTGAPDVETLLALYDDFIHGR